MAWIWRSAAAAARDPAVASVPPARSIVTVAGGADARRGALAALAAYGVWGFFPLLFYLLESVDPVLVVAHRVIWSLIIVGAILHLRGRWEEVRSALASPATLLRIAVSAGLLAANWLIYVWAVVNERVLETSFGYFLNPLVNVALGMAFLGERQNRWQWTAIGIAVLAMGIQAVGIGGIPLVSLSLAVSFALYGYSRKTVKAGSAAGLFVETVVLVPLALGYVAFTLLARGAGPHADPALMAYLVLTGPATSLALLLFAYGVRRLRLTTLGMFQYVAPSIQFILAITFFGEPLNPTRLVSFALIWLSLIIFTADSFRRRTGPNAGRQRLGPEPELPLAGSAPSASPPT